MAAAAAAAPQSQTQDCSWDEGNESSIKDDTDYVHNTVWGRAVSTNKAYNHMELEGDSPITFGRAPSCNVQIANPAVSGIHFCLQRRRQSHTNDEQPDDTLVFLEDTSTNGTYVNARKVTKGKPVLISHGSEVMLIPENSDGTRERVSFVIYLAGIEDYQAQILRSCPHVAEKYVVHELLGTGAFAAVYRCVHVESGAQFALKIIDKNKFRLQGPSRAGALFDEVHILRTLHHPHIVQVYDVFESSTELIIVLELCSGGDVFERIVSVGPYNEDEARCIFRQLLSALSYLHQNRVVHRDLKPENILINSKSSDVVVKISDFGLSRIVSHGQMRMTTVCGTPQYLAPEVLLAARTVDKQTEISSTPTHTVVNGYDAKVDMWSLGVILFILLSGNAPFVDNPRSTIVEQVAKGAVSFHHDNWLHVSQEARDLVLRLITVEPAQRLSTYEAGIHAWLNQSSSSPSSSSSSSPPSSSLLHEDSNTSRKPIAIDYEGNSSTHINSCVDNVKETPAKKLRAVYRT